MLDRSRACGRYRISMLDRPDAVNMVVIQLLFAVSELNASDNFRHHDVYSRDWRGAWH